MERPTNSYQDREHEQAKAASENFEFNRKLAENAVDVAMATKSMTDLAKGSHIGELERLFIALLNVELPDCRERLLAITKIEEATMWAMKGLTR